MFNKSKKQHHDLSINKLSSLIAEGVSLCGDITFSGGLRIDGQVDGNVVSREGEKNLIIISNTGSINGKVRVYDAVINGTLTGELIVENFLELQENAHITGNIIYQKLQMELGAIVEGKLYRPETDNQQNNVFADKNPGFVHVDILPQLESEKENREI